jgi:2-polyprenyl-3-methyl-5-hydroxy-6-metoxy-1,4-benzoquinol methylase
MNADVINQLNQLNQQFYSQVAEAFSQSREQPWTGWLQLKPVLLKLQSDAEPLTVLDLGCGNGRWATFLTDTLKEKSWSYLGIDSNQQLLEEADTTIAKQAINGATIRLDVIETVLVDQLASSLPNQKYDVITLFGLIHHVPSFQLRQKLLLDLSHCLSPHGVLIVAAWRFAEFDRFSKKMINPTQLGINPAELETNDYILDWQRGTASYRYCHYLDDQEMVSLLKATDLTISSQFRADGKEETLNAYYILEHC